jgi:small subunit ribosomal protein S17
MTATDATQSVRSKQSTAIGVVTSDARDKTATVTVSFTVKQAKYGKYIRRRTVHHVHDERNEARKGDTVEISNCRPISKTKSWRLVRVLQAAPREDLA